ncbi:unnamed protein product [marine sediment metagenome]|uniref:Uncharacterized protein n=1 Tax=marine sediment metagenome TaxID=412755 RepID=X0WHH2_9ZZZZ
MEKDKPIDEAELIKLIRRIICEVFHMLVNSEPITHFKQIREDQLQVEDTEIYLMIKDHKPIGYTYWNKASTNEGELDCIRQL